jgi:hypothetical protein
VDCLPFCHGHCDTPAGGIAQFQPPTGSARGLTIGQSWQVGNGDVEKVRYESSDLFPTETLVETRYGNGPLVACTKGALRGTRLSALMLLYGDRWRLGYWLHDNVGTVETSSSSDHLAWFNLSQRP